MKKFLLLVFLFPILISSQDIFDVQVAEAIIETEQTDWGIDNIILNNEPAGSFSGVQKSDGTLYLAVNDTLSTSNLGLVVFVSTDDGATWTLHPSGITFRGHYQKIKMLRSGLDSIHCSFQIGSNVYTWNPLSNNLGQLFSGNYRTYDMVASSTGNLYCFADSLPTNHIPRYGSTNGGLTWGSRALVTSAGAHPKLFMSGTGDTLSLNYYGPVLADTTTSVIRNASYRESGPGTMATAGTFTNIAVEVDYKREFKSVRNKGEIWFIYTLGPDGSRNIMGRKSIDNGVSFAPAIVLAGDANADEYDFDADFFNDGSASGFDVIYTADNTTDIINYISVNYGSSAFTAPENISENPPVFSPNYSPAILPMHFSSADVAALWVSDQGGRKLFWDQLSAIIPVELITFAALPKGNEVMLSWSTATEMNNMGFQVQRKVGNNNWADIAFINGSGTTSEKQNYVFTDVNLNSGIYTYRLKQIDFDGSFEYSNEIEVDIIIPLQYSLEQNFPNPFNPETRIKYYLPFESNVKITVYNSIGEELKELINGLSNAGVHEITFNADEYSSGVYFYSIEASSIDGRENFKNVKKMMVVK